MIDFNNRHLFTPFTHPESGVTFHILTRKVAPAQQGFYFVNDSMSADGRYLWFYCAFPLSLGRTLGVVDFQTGEVRHFPQTQFSGGASPHVDPPSGDVFWGVGPSLWRRGLQPADIPRCVNSLPAELIGAREVSRLATHLTRSANGREFFIDAKIGLQFVLGSLPVDGGDFDLWHRWDRNYDHAQFSPTDPAEALVAACGDIPLGLYECPVPYHRKLSPELLGWAARSGRVRFLKDTCCDLARIRAKLEAIRGTAMGWHNAHCPSLLESLRLGGHGYSGIAANFYPELFVRLCAEFADRPDEAERLQRFLALADGTIRHRYPASAKRWLGLLGLPIGETCRVSAPPRRPDDDEKLMLENLRHLVREMKEMLP